MFHMYITDWQGMRCCWISIGCVISSSSDFDIQIFTFLFRVGRVECISVFWCNHLITGPGEHGCIRELHSPHAPTQSSCGKRELVCQLWGLVLFWCLSLVTLIQAFIVSRVPLDEAGSSLGWGETNVENDGTRRRFAFDPVGTGLVVGISIMMGSEDVECT